MFVSVALKECLIFVIADQGMYNVIVNVYRSRKV